MNGKRVSHMWEGNVWGCRADTVHVSDGDCVRYWMSCYVRLPMAVHRFFAQSLGIYDDWCRAVVEWIKNMYIEIYVLKCSRKNRAASVWRMGGWLKPQLLGILIVVGARNTKYGGFLIGYYTLRAYGGLPEKICVEFFVCKDWHHCQPLNLLPIHLPMRSNIFWIVLRRHGARFRAQWACAQHTNICILIGRERILLDTESMERIIVRPLFLIAFQCLDFVLRSIHTWIAYFCDAWSKIEPKTTTNYSVFDLCR